MKKNSYHLILICVLLSGLMAFAAFRKNTEAESPAISNLSPKDYQLVWSDEFNGDAVDTSSWNFETGGSGWGNHEQEYYQPENASVENGFLVITGKRKR